MVFSPASNLVASTAQHALGNAANTLLARYWHLASAQSAHCERAALALLKGTHRLHKVPSTLPGRAAAFHSPVRQGYALSTQSVSP